MMNQIDVLRASASMPYVSKIVEYQGMKLLDGRMYRQYSGRTVQKDGI